MLHMVGRPPDRRVLSAAHVLASTLSDSHTPPLHPVRGGGCGPPPPSLPPCVTAKEKSRGRVAPLQAHPYTRRARGPTARRKPTTHRPCAWETADRGSRSRTARRTRGRRPMREAAAAAPTHTPSNDGRRRCRPPPRPPAREAPPFAAVTPAESRRRASPHLAVANPCTTGT